jgi:hypothetical protein
VPSWGQTIGCKCQVGEKYQRTMWRGDMATVEKFEDLIVWQKARVLAKRIFELSESGRFAKDFKFVGQINDACDSVMSICILPLIEDTLEMMISRNYMICAKK